MAYPIHQVDMTIAFLNGTLEDEVYMQQPKGFECPGKEEFICKLNKSIYGLKQSPCFWNSTLDAFLKEMQFTQTASDPYISIIGKREKISCSLESMLTT